MAFQPKKLQERPKPKEEDWFDKLTPYQQQSIIKGLEQADNGETISHAEAIIKLSL